MTRGRYWGRQTELAHTFFKIGPELWPPEMVRAQAWVKIAAARANMRAGKLDQRRGRAIIRAATEVLKGSLASEFPLTIWQGGSGTSFNMNMNEVIAARANEILTRVRDPKTPVHPNDHVNMSQSTNDTIPTATHLAALTVITGRLVPALNALALSLSKKARAFKDIRKVGRTHLQDAVTMTLGQEFSGYAAGIAEANERLLGAVRALSVVPLGGTAIGTGLNTPRGYQKSAVRELSRLSGFKLSSPQNLFNAMATPAPILVASAALKETALALIKVANDIRFLASGPRTGLGEITLPAHEAGSSIMPGKVNPTQCEAVMMVACRVIGNDAAVVSAAALLSNFELVTAKPLFAHTLIESASLLADAVASFDRHAVRGIRVNRARLAHYAAESLGSVTIKSATVGYDETARQVTEAYRKGKQLS